MEDIQIRSITRPVLEVLKMGVRAYTSRRGFLGRFLVNVTVKKLFQIVYIDRNICSHLRKICRTR